MSSSEGAPRSSRRVGPAKKKRVRKDKAAADSRMKEQQEDVIRREFDRSLVLEEFAAPRTVDRTRQQLTPPPPPSPAAAGMVEGGERKEEEEEEEEDFDPRRTGLYYDPEEELPIPSEAALSLSDIATRFDGAITTEKKKDGESDALPTLAELGKRAQGKILKRQQEEQKEKEKELEPLDNYDLSSGILGEGRPVMGIGLPYLQSCHTVVLLVALLCTFVEFPGFPLTSLPYEYRDFLKQGFVVIYLINAALAYDSVKQARKRDQSVFFWALKCFVLGALAHNELLLIREKPQASI